MRNSLLQLDKNELKNIVEGEIGYILNHLGEIKKGEIEQRLEWLYQTAKTY